MLGPIAPGDCGTAAPCAPSTVVLAQARGEVVEVVTGGPSPPGQRLGPRPLPISFKRGRCWGSPASPAVTTHTAERHQCRLDLPSHFPPFPTIQQEAANRSRASCPKHPGSWCSVPGSLLQAEGVAVRSPGCDQTRGHRASRGTSFCPRVALGRLEGGSTAPAPFCKPRGTGAGLSGT